MFKSPGRKGGQRKESKWRRLDLAGEVEKTRTTRFCQAEGAFQQKVVEDDSGAARMLDLRWHGDFSGDAK